MHFRVDAHDREIHEDAYQAQDTAMSRNAKLMQLYMRENAGNAMRLAEGGLAVLETRM